MSCYGSGGKSPDKAIRSGGGGGGIVLGVSIPVWF